MRLIPTPRIPAGQPLALSGMTQALAAAATAKLAAGENGCCWWRSMT